MTQELTQQLSSKMLPSKIHEGQVKKFKLLNAGEIDPVTNAPSYNAGATFEGISSVYDKDRGQIAIIKNITGRRLTKDGNNKDITEETISPVEFDSNGIIIVRHDQPETNLFLSRDNRNATNPFRDKAVPAVWEEIIQVNVKQKLQLRNDLEYSAMTLIKTSDAKAIIAIATILAEKKFISVNLKGNITDIRWELESLCKINPAEVIRAGKEKLPKIKLDIQSAIDHGEIEFVYDGNVWQWIKELPSEKDIIKVSAGKDPVEELAAYMLKEVEEMATKKREDRTETLLDKIKNTLNEPSVED